ncbi:MAG: hypothetical protein JWN20_731 [Jatrophihabitantaceae bacterium]|nr:hypothetical protein [Jatrophihabitantaceae bacterium]
MTSPAAAPTNAGTASAGIAAQALDVTKVYGTGETQVRALDGVSADFASGQFHAIMGPSGSGKSTLMHCLAGLDTISSGEVLIAGRPLSKAGDKELTELRREHVGFIFQQFNLLPTLTARENILLPLSIAGRKPDPKWFDAVIDAVGLRDRLSHRPTELSGGQQQRVACARALVSRPAVVFADEPTGNLDSTSASEVLEFLRRTVDDFGQTIVMVTHDAKAAAFADRILFLADGRIVDEMHGRPTAELVLDRMKQIDARVAGAPAAAPGQL